MKLKHLIIVSLILAIFAIGAVSASEDVAIDDELAVDEGVEIEETPVDEEIGESEDSEPALSDVAPEDFNVKISDSVDLSDENNIAINYTAPAGIKGYVNVYMTDNEYPTYSENFDEPENSQNYSLDTDDIDIHSPGTYKVLVKFVPSEGDNLTLAEGTLNVVKTYTKNEFQISWTTNIDYKGEEVVNVWSYPVKGTLIVSVNGTSRFNKQINNPDEDDISVYLSNLGITENGKYNVSAKYITNTSQEIELGNRTVTVDVDWITDEYVSVYSSVNKVNPYDSLVSIEDYSDYINGTISIYVDGALKLTKSISASEKEYEVYFDLQDLGLYNNINSGKHTVKAVYMKNNKEEHKIEKSVEFYAEAVFDTDYYMAVGEKAAFIVRHDKGFKGTATLYNTVGENDDKGAVYGFANFVDGVATIYLTSLPKGETLFLLNITGRDQESYVYVYVKENAQEISASVATTTIEVGNSVTIKLTGPSTLNQDYSVYIDDIYQDKELNPFKTGSDSMTYKFTTAGQHIIKILGNGEKFYSNTFQVTVKDKTPTTPVKVVKKATKITAKKATFKAKKKVKKYTITLKAGKAAVKKVRVTLKVGKKTYKATTNAKGKATFKINKLTKKGKYQAVIKFAGNKNYKASKKTVSIIVKK